MTLEIFDNAPEYRLYYDDKGCPITYVVGYFEHGDVGPDGQYIVIDKFQFLCKRTDIRVVDGKIASVESVVSKLAPKATGTKCAKEDISIVIEDDYPEYIIWGVDTSEQ